MGAGVTINIRQCTYAGAGVTVNIRQRTYAGGGIITDIRQHTYRSGAVTADIRQRTYAEGAVTTDIRTYKGSCVDDDATLAAFVASHVLYGQLCAHHYTFLLKQTPV